MTGGGRWNFRAADARLSGPGVDAALERRTAALLAYLAHSGPAPRSRLAGLLYPDVPEARARNNLAQLVRRLHRLTGEPLVAGDSAVGIVAALHVELDLELLEGVNFADLPEVEQWVRTRRDEAREARKVECRRAAAEAEREGRTAEAAAHLETLLALDALAEDAWVNLMRLRYLNGDLDGARAAFDECRRVLREQLGTGPLPATLRLGEELDANASGQPLRLPDPEPARSTPLNPPVLVGRGREWALLEEAWARGQVIVISGPPGIGKTRLAREFAASRGPFAFQEARPGDAPLPYSAAARNLRRIIRQYPGAALDPEVRRELSRIVPELGEGAVPPQPLRDEPGRLKFYLAAAHVLQCEAAHVACTVDDDSQYYDLASLELGMFIFAEAARQAPPEARPRLIFTCRSDEWPAPFLDSFNQLRALGLGFHLELGPLSAEAVGDLAASLGLAPDPAALTEAAEGNPLFVLEALRHLGDPHVSGGPGAGTVQDLITARLARLSPPALLTARAAGVLQSDFDPELVAEVVQAPLLTVGEAWEELETARVLAGPRFAHDLVAEAVRSGMPQAVRRMLHRGAARALEVRIGAAPARVAEHWLDGQDPARAAPWLLRAAEQVARAGRPAEALAYFTQADEVYASLADHRGRAEVQRSRVTWAPQGG